MKINFGIWLTLGLSVALAQGPADQALLRAVGAGDSAGVRAALQQGADPNSESSSGPALYIAADLGHAEMVGLLLESGADPNAGLKFLDCEKGITPLMVGAQNPEIVQKLLAAGADPNLSDCASTKGATALDYAVGNTESMRLLLSRGGTTGGLGFFFPIPSVYMGNKTSPLVNEVAMREPGWSVSALLVAIWGGDSTSTQLLLGAGFLSVQKGEGSPLTDPTGLDPLMAAAGTAWDDEAAGRQVFEQLMEKVDYSPTHVDFWWQDNALTYALEAGRVEWAGDLVERGFDPAHRDILGRDLLVRALDEQIPPRLADMRWDNIPQVDKPELARFLIAQGVSPEPERLVGQPLWSNHLLAAIQDQDRELVTALIQGGADPDSGSFDGKTPLIHAVQNQNLELVQALIEAGASLDAPDHSGKTALIYATQNRDLDLVQALLAVGAKPNRSDLEDKTALDYAREMGNQELVELLQGAKP